MPPLSMPAMLRSLTATLLYFHSARSLKPGCHCDPTQSPIHPPTQPRAASTRVLYAARTREAGASHPRAHARGWASLTADSSRLTAYGPRSTAYGPRYAASARFLRGTPRARARGSVSLQPRLRTRRTRSGSYRLQSPDSSARREARPPPTLRLATRSLRALPSTFDFGLSTCPRSARQETRDLAVAALVASKRCHAPALRSG